MGFYKYSAKERSGKKVKGFVEASTKMEAFKQLKSKGLKNITLQVSKTAGGDKLKALSLKEKIDFTQTFQTLHKAGVPIIESLMFIGNEAASVKIRNIASTVRQAIMEGGTFAGTIGKYPHIFDEIYKGLVQAGEDSGELDKTLERLSELLKKQASIKGKVIGALLYPVFVVVLAIVIVIVMVVFVFPKFADVFATTGRELPPITKMCISLGNSITGYWWLYIVVIIFAAFLMKKAMVWRPSREIIDKVSLKIPIIDQLLIKANFSNFLTVLLVAYNAGIPIVNCISLSNLTLTNIVLKDALTQAGVKVSQGTQLSLALKASDVVPKMIVFMISTGEQSGRLGELLENAVYFIDQELDKAVDVMTKMMEPLLIIVIGFIVLFLALAFYLPLFGMAQV